MSTLNNLINQKVIAEIEGEHKTYFIKGTITGVDVNDFYFYDKGEPIYIFVSMNSDDALPEGLNIEELMEIPLKNIRKS